jgi:putative heme-binding domain-containing protein
LRGAINADRQKVLDDYHDVPATKGDAAKGKAVFAKACAGCHQLEVGHRVGSRPRALANKTPQYLLQEILDPNRNMDSRYLQYAATTRAGQVFTACWRASRRRP